jgi:hypothetical protein
LRMLTSCTWLGAEFYIGVLTLCAYLVAFLDAEIV